jgi:hypothetical protein
MKGAVHVGGQTTGAGRDSRPNPVTGALDQVWSSVLFLTIHPADKFHGSQDIERLAAGEDRLVPAGRDSPVR